MTTPRQDRLIELACVLAGAVVACSLAPAAAGAKTLHVKAGAKPDGDGSRSAPFDSLAAVERASRRGDRIVVRASKAPALDGGIALKPGQRLIGRRPRISFDRPDQPAPRLTNTDPERNNGDAVRLASRTVVKGLVIAGTYRGGIYGRNVRGVQITGNDVSAHNTSCTPGFHIFPFIAPTNVPGVGIPISDGLHNGWAGIMVDADRGRGRIEIRRNRVHDAECGDGIDIRLAGSARRRAEINANRIAYLRQGPDFESLLAIGLQSAERSRLRASLDRNRQTKLGNAEDLGIGPEGADTEGLFFNIGGPSVMRATVDRNTYTNPDGWGGFSANGLEMVSMGDGGRGHLVVRRSSFTGSPGDVIEEGALGTDARLYMKLVDVEAARSTGVGNTVILPFNNGDCVLAGSLGARNSVELDVRRSRFTDCANNGLGVGSSVVNGSGPTSEIDVDIRASRITGNRGANLGIRNFTELERLQVRVERTDLSNSRGTGSAIANLAAEDLGTTGEHVIDLGGGPLGSPGQNCLAGGVLAADVVGYDVSAQMNWWGSPGGPGPGRALAAGGSLDTSDSRATAPVAVC